MELDKLENAVVVFTRWLPRLNSLIAAANAKRDRAGFPSWAATTLFQHHEPETEEVTP